MSEFLPDVLIATLCRPLDRGPATARVSVEIAFLYNRRR